EFKPDVGFSWPHAIPFAVEDEASARNGRDTSIRNGPPVARKRSSASPIERAEPRPVIRQAPGGNDVSGHFELWEEGPRNDGPIPLKPSSDQFSRTGRPQTLHVIRTKISVIGDAARDVDALKSSGILQHLPAERRRVDVPRPEPLMTRPARVAG